MVSVAAVRSGLACRLETIAGLRVYRTWPDQLHGPAVVIDHDFGPDQETIGGGLDYLRIELMVFGGRAASGLARAQDALDPYLATSGESSIRAAIRGDRTLGAIVDTATVGAATDMDVVEVAGIEYIGCRLPVEVWG